MAMRLGVHRRAAALSCSRADSTLTAPLVFFGAGMCHLDLRHWDRQDDASPHDLQPPVTNGNCQRHKRRTQRACLQMYFTCKSLAKEEAQLILRPTQ